jgi:zinc protease
MKEEFARVLKDGFTDEEVKKGINGILQQWQNDRSEDAGLSRTLATYLFIDRTFEFNEGLEKKVSQLKAQDVNRVFRKVVSWEAFTVVKAGDF